MEIHPSVRVVLKSSQSHNSRTPSFGRPKRVLPGHGHRRRRGIPVEEHPAHEPNAVKRDAINAAKATLLDPDAVEGEGTGSA